MGQELALMLGDLEVIHMHPHLGERIHIRVPGLKGESALTGLHHQRLDGSGYTRGIGGTELGSSNGSRRPRTPTIPPWSGVRAGLPLRPGSPQESGNTWPAVPRRPGPWGNPPDRATVGIP